MAAHIRLSKPGTSPQSNGWITDYSQTYSEKGLAQSRMWPKGTLAITIAANIGATAILTFDACFPDSIVGFTPKEGISAEYVRWWLLGYQRKLEAQAPQGAQKNINLKALRSIRIPVPPPSLQQRFQAQLINIHEQLDLMAKALISAKALAESLTANAFSGELTAKWRERHDAILQQEARDRDDALQAQGVKLPRPPKPSEAEAIFSRCTDGAYAELTRDQHAVLEAAQRGVGGVKTPRWFTSEQVAKQLGGGWRKNIHAIEAALAVLAARGLVIPVSREDAQPITGEIYFGTAYRLPQATYEDTLATESGDRIVTEAGEPLSVGESDGDKARQRELKRFGELIRKGRPE